MILICWLCFKVHFCSDVQLNAQTWFQILIDRDWCWYFGLHTLDQFWRMIGRRSVLSSKPNWWWIQLTWCQHGSLFLGKNLVSIYIWLMHCNAGGGHIVYEKTYTDQSQTSIKIMIRSIWIYAILWEGLTWAQLYYN